MRSSVILHRKGKYITYQYKSERIVDLLEGVFNLVSESDCEIEPYLIHLSDGTDLLWNSSLAQACFGKGILSEDEFILACRFIKPKQSKTFEVIVELDYHSEFPEGIAWLNYEPLINAHLPNKNKAFGFLSDSNLIQLKLTAESKEMAIEYAEKYVFSHLIVKEVDVCTVKELNLNIVLAKGGKA